MNNSKKDVKACSSNVARNEILIIIQVVLPVRETFLKFNTYYVDRYVAFLTLCFIFYCVSMIMYEMQTYNSKRMSWMETIVSIIN